MDDELTPERMNASAGLNHPKLNSMAEFFRDLSAAIGLFRKSRKNLSRLDPVFRESICLTVTYANNCRL